MKSEIKSETTFKMDSIANQSTFGNMLKLKQKLVKVKSIKVPMIMECLKKLVVSNIS